MLLPSLRIHKQPIETGAMAVFPYDEETAKKFVLTTRFGEPYSLFERSGPYLFLPRSVAPLGKIDNRVLGAAINVKMQVEPKDEEQARMVAEQNALLKQGVSFVLKAGTGMGKCHGKGTPILLYDGRIVAVEDVKVGDLLMGPDSKPRRVLSTTVGTGPLYRVTPNKGEPFVCNDAHVLSLKRTGVEKSKEHLYPELINVPLTDYLAWGKTQKHVYKLWRTGVEFAPKFSLPIDPYFMGVLLGDGGITKAINVTTMDPEIAEECSIQAAKWGLGLRKAIDVSNRAAMYYFVGRKGRPNTNRLRLTLEDIGLMPVSCAGKFIPRCYKVASREDRLEILAGLIDTDGCLSFGFYDVCFKSKLLADDTAFLAGSLGFGVTRSVRVVKGVPYYRMAISGDIIQIPVRLKRKKASMRGQKKNVLRSGFSIEPLGEGDYYGFTLDQDHLYLLGDFTVTHNTACAAFAIAAVQRKTLIVVPKEPLMKQFRERMKTFLGLKDHQIGTIQADKVDVTGKPVVLAMLQSVCLEDRYDSSVFADFGLVILDEVHRASATSMSKFFRNVPARLRVGYSATVKRADGKEQVLYSHIGPILVEGVGIPMIPKVMAFKTGYKIPRVMRRDEMTGKPKSVQLPHSAGKIMHILTKMAQDPARNDMIGRLAKMAYDKDRHVILFTHTLDHIEAMLAACRKRGIPMTHLGKFVGGMSEAAQEAASTKRVVAVTYGSFKEGIDWPWFDTGIFGTPLSDVEQAAGRVIRKLKDKRQPILMDLIDDDSKVLAGYWNKRQKWYAKIGAQVSVL